MSINPLSQYKDNLLKYMKVKTFDHTLLFNDLMKKSKQLVLNTEQYDNYSNYYTTLTSIHSFKLPDISAYPIQINKEFIPLKKHNVKEKIPNIKKQFFHNTSRNILSTQETVVKTEGNINNKEINEETFLKYIDIFNNKNNIIHRYIDYKEKYFINKDVESNKTFLKNFILENAVEEKDFLKETEKINKLKIDNGNIDVKIKFRSIKIIFYELNNKKNSFIKFPFWFIPFFYSINFKDFNLFLSKVVDYDPTEKTFKMNHKNALFFYKVFVEEGNFCKDNSLFLKTLNKKAFKDEYDWITTDEKTQKKEKYRIKIILPQMSFKLRVHPSYSQIKVIKISNLPHTLYFLRNGFEDWDFYMLNTFCVYQKFRFIVNRALSYDSKFKNKKMCISLNRNPTLDVLSQSTFDFFITTSKGISFYIELHAPKVQYTFELYNKIFNLTMKEVIQMNMLAKYFSNEEIIQRCLNIHSHIDEDYNETVIDNVEINTKMIFNFNKSLLKFMIPRAKSGCSCNPQIHKNSNFSISEPIIKWTTFIDAQRINKLYTIDKDKGSVLFGNVKFEQWGEFISDFYQDIEKNSIEFNENFSLFNNNALTDDISVIQLKKKNSSKRKLRFK